MKVILSKVFRPKTLLIIGAVGLTLVFLFGLFLNGPGYRMIMSRSIAAYSKNEGFTSEFKLTGSIAKGFTINDLKISGLENSRAYPIRAMHLGQLDLKCNFAELIRRPKKLNWLSNLQVADLDLEIDLASEESEHKPPGKMALPDFAAAWNLLRSEIALSNINILLRRGDTQLLHIDNLSVESHASNSDGNLQIDTLKVANFPTIKNLKAPIKVEQGSLQTTIVLNEWDITLRDLILKPDSSEQSAELSGQLAAGGGSIDFSANSESLAIALSNGKIELEKITPLSLSYPDLGATINHLDIKLVDNILQGQCDFTNLGYGENYEIGKASAIFDSIHLDPEQQIATKGIATLQLDELEIWGSTIDSLTTQATTTESESIAITAKAHAGEQKLLQIDGHLNQKTLSYKATGELNGQLDKLAPFPKVAGLANIKWQGHGQLRETSHTGSAKAQLKEFHIQGSEKTSGGFDLAYADNSLQLRNLDLKHIDESVQLTGAADINKQSIQLKSISLVRDKVERLKLNGEIKLAPELANSHADIHFQSDNLDPNDIAGFFRKTLPIEGFINGKLSANGAFDDLKANANFVFTPKLNQSSQQKPQIHLVADFAGNVTTPNTWKLESNSVISGLKYDQTLLEDLSVNITTDPDGSLLTNLAIDQSGAKIRSLIRADLKEAKQLDDLTKIPLLGQLSASIPEIQALRQAFPFKAWKDLPISGDLNASIDHVIFKQGDLTAGTANIHANALAIENQSFQKLQLNGNIVTPNQLQSHVDIALDSQATTKGNISYHLKEKTYQGDLNLVANLTNQGKLHTLLTNRVAAEILPESTRLKWTGQGDLKKQQHQNELTVDVEKLRLATQAEPIDISLKGSLSDHSANFPQLSITGKDLSVGGTLLWQNNQIQLSQLSGFFEQKLFLSGSAQAPFSKDDLPIKNWFSRKDPLSVNLAITNAPLHRLARFVQPELPVQGILNSEFSTTGSPASPQINWALDATELITISAEGEPVDLGDLNLVMSTKGSIAQINGSLASPDIKPLQFSGQQPFHPADWATKRRDWKTEPLQLQLNLEPSSLAVFTPRIPEIKSLVGNIALDASVQGSFAKPTVTGYGKLDISRLKLRDRNAPSIRDMKGLVRFSGNEVILEKFNAIVAGGTLSASGRADLSQGDPVIDLAIKGKDVLVFRNHDVNVRTDVHLAATGPWQQLAIVGELGINNSYFVKNIDLLPSSLPRFRKSEVPSVESGPVVSNLAVGVPNSPFSDWTTDIRIYTKSPFLIRGNIGHGSANCDLKITGPLAAPTPIGDIIISEGTRLTLPFSRIDIETGRIRFNESTAFNGQLELKARGEADQYDINIFIHDRLLSPQHVLTSNPPLPTEDIMTLLVTGNVRDDLIGSDATRIAASKAASLFLKNLNKNTNAQSQNELLNELRDRTEIDFGSFNLNNGIDSVGGRIRLWQQLFFVGNASWDDEYRALLKYIFSFS